MPHPKKRRQDDDDDAAKFADLIESQLDPGSDSDASGFGAHESDASVFGSDEEIGAASTSSLKDDSMRSLFFSAKGSGAATDASTAAGVDAATEASTAAGVDATAEASAAEGIGATAEASNAAIVDEANEARPAEGVDAPAERDRKSSSKSDGSDDEAEEAVKQKSPKKRASSMKGDSESSHALESSEESPTKKRGRGRPRKHVRESSQESATKKRGRGRPTKKHMRDFDYFVRKGLIHKKKNQKEPITDDHGYPVLDELETFDPTPKRKMESLATNFPKFAGQRWGDVYYARRGDKLQDIAKKMRYNFSGVKYGV